jgi:hypothetical protein
MRKAGRGNGRGEELSQFKTSIPPEYDDRYTQKDFS